MSDDGTNGRQAAVTSAVFYGFGTLVADLDRVIRVLCVEARKR